MAPRRRRALGAMSAGWGCSSSSGWTSCFGVEVEVDPGVVGVGSAVVGVGSGGGVVGSGSDVVGGGSGVVGSGSGDTGVGRRGVGGRVLGQRRRRPGDADDADDEGDHGRPRGSTHPDVPAHNGLFPGGCLHGTRRRRVVPLRHDPPATIGAEAPPRHPSAQIPPERAIHSRIHRPGRVQVRRPQAVGASLAGGGIGSRVGSRGRRLPGREGSRSWIMSTRSTSSGGSRRWGSRARCRAATRCTRCASSSRGRSAAGPGAPASTPSTWPAGPPGCGAARPGSPSTTTSRCRAALRRRFFRAGGVVVSRYEVEAQRLSRCAAPDASANGRTG